MHSSENGAASRIRTAFWPDVTRPQAARAAMLQGVWASVFICVVTSAAALAGLGGLNAYAFIDVALFAAVGIGIWRHSRTAAVGGLVLYALERVIQMAEGVPAGALVVAAAFVLCYANAIRGTFAWHRRKHGMAA